MTIEIIGIIAAIVCTIATVHVLVNRNKNILYNWINEQTYYKNSKGIEKIVDSEVKDFLEKSYLSMSKRILLVSILITPTIIYFYLNDISLTNSYLKYISIVALISYIVVMGFLTNKELNVISNSFIKTKIEE